MLYLAGHVHGLVELAWRENAAANPRGQVRAAPAGRGAHFDRETADRDQGADSRVSERRLTLSPHHGTLDRAEALVELCQDLRRQARVALGHRMDHGRSDLATQLYQYVPRLRHRLVRQLRAPHAALRTIEQGVVRCRHLGRVSGHRSVREGTFLQHTALEREGFDELQRIAHRLRLSNGGSGMGPLRLGGYGDPGRPPERRKAGGSEAEKEHRLEAHVSAVPNTLQVRTATLCRDC